MPPWLQAPGANAVCAMHRFRYNRGSVEILLNCVWLVLGLSLIAIWSLGAVRTQAKEQPLLPSRRAQFTAVLLLVVLLFPVISLTDDLARCAAPQESERALRLHDPLDGAHAAPAVLPSALAWAEAIATSLDTGDRRPIEERASIPPLLTGTRLPVDSRPPPAHS